MLLCIVCIGMDDLSVLLGNRLRIDYHNIYQLAIVQSQFCQNINISAHLTYLLRITTDSTVFSELTIPST